MNISQKILTLVATCSISAGAYAADLAGTTEVARPEAMANHDLSVEATLQFSSLGLDGTTLFGPAMFYGFDTSNSAGMRALLPVGKTGSYSLSALYRNIFLERNKSHLFVEPSISLNVVNFSPVIPSMGFAVGFAHHLTNEISAGGTAGMEMHTSDSIASAGTSLGGAIFSPKASMTVNVLF